MSAKISPSLKPVKIVGSAEGSWIFQEHLERRQLEAAPDIEQHIACARQALDGFQDHGGEAGNKTHHHDGCRRASENHEKERIHQHGRRRCKRRHPGFGGAAEKIDLVHDRADGNSKHRKQCRCGEAFLERHHEAIEHMLFKDDAFEAGRDLRGHRHDEFVDQPGAYQDFDDQRSRNECAEAERKRQEADAGECKRGHFRPRARLSASSSPRVASSRRSAQIWAT